MPQSNNPANSPKHDIQVNVEMAAGVAEELACGTSGDVITLHGFDGVCLYASVALHTMLGFDPSEFVGQPLVSFFHPEDAVLGRHVIEQHARGRSERSITHRLRRKDGQFLWCETTTKISRAIKSRPDGCIIAITRDIAKRKRAEEEIKAMHLLLSSVFESVPVGLCIIDTEGLVWQCNRSFAATIGRSYAETCGQSARQLLSCELLEAQSVEVQCPRLNGDSFPAHITLTKLGFSEHADMLVTITDKTEQLAMDAKLREAQRLESMGTLAGGIAHDFNNLLAIILGYASLLKQAAPDNPRVAEYGDTIIEAGRRGADVVRQLMLYANQHEPMLVKCDVHSILGDVLVRTSADWPERIKLECHFLADHSEIPVDAEQIGSAVEHLLRNAKESIMGTGTVHLCTADRESKGERDMGLRWVEISVEDNGCGMESSVRERIFEPFFVHNKGPEVKGLGLPLVYGIAKAHRGKVEVRSTLGRGTRISMLLPLPLETPSVPAPKQVSEEYSLKADACVLLVEDEVDIGKLWMDLLARQGWKAHWAKDGEEALALFEQHKNAIDLVFSDIGLPGELDGWEVCARIRVERPDIPVILASGYFKRNPESSPGLTEPVFCVDKPYQPMDVLDKMKDSLGFL